MPSWRYLHPFSMSFFCRNDSRLSEASSSFFPLFTALLSQGKDAMLITSPETRNQIQCPKRPRQLPLMTGPIPRRSPAIAHPVPQPSEMITVARHRLLTLTDLVPLIQHRAGDGQAERGLQIPPQKGQGPFFASRSQLQLSPPPLGTAMPSTHNTQRLLPTPGGGQAMKERLKVALILSICLSRFSEVRLLPKLTFGKGG